MSVRVVARIRPLFKSENERDIIVTPLQSDQSESSTVVACPNPRNPAEQFKYHFNSVYPQSTSQQTLFDSEITPTVKHLFSGFDCTIFAYGVTGTGKTYTIRGGKALADRGVIPRLLSAVYRRGRKLEKDTEGRTQIEVAASYYEIYNDKIYDLFEPPEKRTPSGLPLRDNNGKTVVVGLTEKSCTTLKEFEQLYDLANVNRSTSATKLNAHSSRSHAIMTVKVSQVSPGSTRTSTVSIIDLAGSEDNRRTDNNKERLVESSAINKSLFVLAQCVEAIQKKSARIPYRESKMTRILSLGNQRGLTVMILNLSPMRAHHLDTVQSLSFASRAKQIEIREVENEPVARGMTKPLLPVKAGSVARREPLKPIMNAENMSLKPVVVACKTDMPAKAFNVYRSSGSRESLKRPLSTTLSQPSTRPVKLARPNERRPPVSTTAPNLSRASVEEMVDRMIEEKLANRALVHSETTTAPQPLNEELQRRLDALESRIDTKEGGRAEGLQYLLMGKQHQAHGELASALRMYRLALPFFPENEKLALKISTLQAKLEMQRSEAMSASNSKPSNPLRRDHHSEVDDDEYQDQGDNFEDSDPDDFRSMPRKRPRTTSRLVKAKLGVRSDDCADASLINLSPRSSQLLDIINSRDISQIKSLKGVGAKRAESIIAALLDLEDGRLTSLKALEDMKGVGAGSVFRMRDGLLAG